VEGEDEALLSSVPVEGSTSIASARFFASRAYRERGGEERRK
jgi:hypothetical protein